MSTTCSAQDPDSSVNSTRHGTPCWIRIPCVSVSRAQKFYTDIFGWKFREPIPEYPVDKFSAFSIPGSSVMGGLVKTDELEEGKDGGVQGGIMVSLMVDDVDATLEKIKGAGGLVVKGKSVEGGHTEMGTFEDTEGNRVGILKWLI